MSSTIHVHNASEQTVIVQCYKPGSSDKWGGEYTIEPGQNNSVYEAGMFERGPDLSISQCVYINKRNGNKERVKIRATRFRSDKDKSWIVKESNVVQQEYGKDLDKEDPNGEHKSWDVSAKKITLKDVKYKDLPNKPQSWTPNMMTGAKVVNNNKDKATLSGKIGLTFSESKSWSHKAGIKISVKTSVKAGIPLLAEGKIEIGAEASYEYSWGGSQTESRTWEQSVSIPVDPNKSVSMHGKAMQGKVTVPYTATFILEYDGSDEKVETEIMGEYSGVCAKMTEIQVDAEEPLVQNIYAEFEDMPEELKLHEGDINSTIELEPGSKANILYNDITGETKVVESL